MNDVQMFWSLCAECVEFLSQMRSGAILIESRHGEGQTDKQGLYQRKRSDRVLTTYIRYVLACPPLFILFLCLFLISVCMALSTVFHSINFLDNSLWYFCLIGPFNYISLYESLLQPWHNPQWLTGLKPPVNLLTNSCLMQVTRVECPRNINRLKKT